MLHAVLQDAQVALHDQIEDCVPHAPAPAFSSRSSLHVRVDHAGSHARALLAARAAIAHACTQQLLSTQARD
jgi:hypothetical protein